MDKNELFKIFMEYGAEAVDAYYGGNLDQFLVSMRMNKDDLGDFEDDGFGSVSIWYAMKDLARMFNKDELRKLGVRFGYNNDPESAYLYAKEVIKDRWPEAEEAIKQDGWVIYRYAKRIIGGRWPEAESIIKQNPWDAYRYAKSIIRDRWPEAEEIIKSNQQAWHSYVNWVRDDI